MSLCRRSQKLATSDRVRISLLQAFCRPTLRQQEAGRWLPSEDARQVHISAQVQWPATMQRAELSPSGHSGIAKSPEKAGPGTMSKYLVNKVMGLSDVKEDVYRALDEWAAFELEFPVVAARKTLEKLRKMQQWHRVIQVTKWMFSKGLGKTHGSYALLLKAYCLEGRWDEAEELWNALIASNNRSMPKNLFSFMTNAYRRREMPKKVVEVFEQMESFGIKPDKDILRRVEEAYQQLNMQEKVEQLGKRYAIDSKTRRKERRLRERKEKKILKLEQLEHQVEGNASLEYQTDEGEEDAEKQVTTVREREERASFRTEHLEYQVEGNASLEYQTDEEDAEKLVTTVQQREERASSRRDATPNRSRSSRRGKKSDLTVTTEDEFVKQIIDTM